MAFSDGGAGRAFWQGHPKSCRPSMMLAREQPIGQWQEARAAPDEAAENGPVPESSRRSNRLFHILQPPRETLRGGISSVERLTHQGLNQQVASGVRRGPASAEAPSGAATSQ